MKIYKLSYGVMPDSTSGITRELVFTNKRKALAAAKALLKALPADWTSNTGDHLLYFEAEEVTVHGITGEGFVTLDAGVYWHESAAWDDLPSRIELW